MQLYGIDVLMIVPPLFVLQVTGFLGPQQEASNPLLVVLATEKEERNVGQCLTQTGDHQNERGTESETLEGREHIFLIPSKMFRSSERYALSQNRAKSLEPLQF